MSTRLSKPWWGKANMTASPDRSLVQLAVAGQHEDLFLSVPFLQGQGHAAGHTEAMAEGTIHGFIAGNGAVGNITQDRAGLADLAEILGSKNPRSARMRSQGNGAMGLTDDKAVAVLGPDVSRVVSEDVSGNRG